MLFPRISLLSRIWKRRSQPIRTRTAPRFRLGVEGLETRDVPTVMLSAALFALPAGLAVREPVSELRTHPQRIYSSAAIAELLGLRVETLLERLALLDHMQVQLAVPVIGSLEPNIHRSQFARPARGRQRLRCGSYYR